MRYFVIHVTGCGTCPSNQYDAHLGRRYCSAMVNANHLVMEAAVIDNHQHITPSCPKYIITHVSRV